MTWLTASVGVVLVVIAWRDIFHTLWHPSGLGAVSRLVFRLVWRATRLASRHFGATELAGPLALLTSIVVWTMLSVIGFGLVYLPHMRVRRFASSIWSVPRPSSVPA